MSANATKATAPRQAGAAPVQKPLDPGAGFISLVETEPYPSSPRKWHERVRWALKAPIASSSAKVVAVVLADKADKHGRAWPALDTIAQETSMTRRGVTKAVKSLENAGWLTGARHPRRTSSYWLKALAERHCQQCWHALPRTVSDCASCGYRVEPRSTLGGTTSTL